MKDHILPCLAAVTTASFSWASFHITQIVSLIPGLAPSATPIQILSAYVSFTLGILTLVKMAFHGVQAVFRWMKGRRDDPQRYLKFK